MNKRFLFTLGILVLFLTTSCNNLIEGYGHNELSFEIGSRVADSITNTLAQNDDTTELTIDCELLRGETPVKKDSLTVSLEKLYEARFNLNNIPNGNNYFISLSVYYKNHLIYKALSDLIVLNEENEEVNINLSLKQNNSEINYELNGGEFPDGINKPEEYFITSKVTFPEPVKANHKFDGWYSSKDFTPETRVTELGEKCFLGDVTLYAKWIENVSDVTFSKTGAVDYEEKVTLNCGIPGAEIYYSIDNGPYQTLSSPYEIIITKDTTIKAYATKAGMNNSEETTATYTIKKYTVTFDAGGHGTAPGTISGKKKGDVIDLQELTETNFTFDGWFDGESKVHDDTYKYTVNKDVTLTARWIKLGGVTSVSFTPSQALGSDNAIDKGENIKLSCSTEGATIWYTTDGSDPKNSGTKIKYTGTPIVIENDVTIRAYAEKAGQTPSVENKQTYKVKTYTVTFLTDHGTAPADITGKKKGDVVTKPADLSTEGFTFEGWYNNGVKVTEDINVECDITLTAQWKAHSYKVHFNSNSTKSTGTMNDLPMVYGGTKALTANAFEVPGYSFDGWYLDKNYSGSKYTNQMEVTNLSSKDGDTVNLFAKWIANTYTVSFDANGGEGTVMSDKSMTYDKSETLTANTYTRTGYNFIGWNKEKNPSDKTGNIDDGATAIHNLTTTKDGNVTLYAQWEVITYTITYMNCDTPVVNSTNPATYTVEDEVIFSNPTKTDYNFLGWFDDSGFATASQNISKGTTGNKTLYANWIVSANLSDLTFSRCSSQSKFLFGSIKGTNLYNIVNQVKFTCEKLPELKIIPYTDNLQQNARMPFDQGIYIAVRGPINAGDYTIVAEYPGERVTTTLEVREYAPVNMGDIILNDGTILPKGTTLSSVQQEQAVGIALGKLDNCGVPIFIKKIDEKVNGQSTPFAWAVLTFDEQNNPVPERPNDSPLYLCGPNGKDNLGYIKESIKAPPIDIATEMPAFSGCDDTWFIPSKEELAVYTSNRGILEPLFAGIKGQSLLQTNPYWTSSFDKNDRSNAYTFKVIDGTTAATFRTTKSYVRLFGTPYQGKPLNP